MRLRILGNMGGACKGAYTMSSLIDYDILLDAGTGAQMLSLAEMGKISDILLTHSHLDHTVMIPLLVDCKIGNDLPGMTLHCLQETADSIRNGLFNSGMWVDMENIIINGAPLIKFNIIKPYETIDIKGRRFTPLPVKHAVPTLGFCLHGGRTNFVFIADMMDAEDDFWQYLNNLENFRDMVIEVSYPNDMEKLAIDSFHLTPTTLATQLGKLPAKILAHYCHVKPLYAKTVETEISDTFKGQVVPLKQEQIFFL